MIATHTHLASRKLTCAYARRRSQTQARLASVAIECTKARIKVDYYSTVNQTTNPIQTQKQNTQANKFYGNNKTAKLFLTQNPKMLTNDLMQSLSCSATKHMQS